MSGLTALLPLPALLVGLVLLLPLGVGTAQGARPAVAVLDVPPVVLAAYRAAAATVAADEPACTVPWVLLAGIGKVETDHGRFGGSRADEDGQVRPPILGVVLDGRTPGTRAVADTDGGRLDGDARWDRAVGPMQFIPGTWARHGRDADGDGDADPQHVGDAALGAATLLCAAGGPDLTDPAAERRAVMAYNASAVYLADVTGWAATYAAAEAAGGDGLGGEGGLVDGVVADGTWTRPAPTATRIASPFGMRTHPISGVRRLHAGVDLPCAHGAPIVAASAGEVVHTGPQGGAGVVVLLAHPGGVRTRYLHLQAGSVLVDVGEVVAGGQRIAGCGSTGASTGPHLHLEVHTPGGGAIDPVAFLAARGVALP